MQKKISQKSLAQIFMPDITTKSVTDYQLIGSECYVLKIAYW